MIVLTLMVPINASVQKAMCLNLREPVDHKVTFLHKAVGADFVSENFLLLLGQFMLYFSQTIRRVLNKTQTSRINGTFRLK